MKNKNTGTGKRLRNHILAAAVAAFILLPPGAQSAQLPAYAAGPHNDHMIVVFGAEIRFEEYTLVSILDQSFTVVRDAPYGARYSIEEKKTGERILTIK